MKGCAGKGISYIFGVVTGMLLFVMVVVLSGYLLISQVTLAKVEKVTGKDIPLIDDNAKVKDMTILQIGEFLKNKGFSQMTLDDVKTVFGVDVVEIVEKTLTDETQGTKFVVEGPSRDALMKTPVLSLLNKTDILLDCILLGDVAARLGQDLSSMPIVKNYLDYPVTEALSAITSAFDFKDGGMTFGDLQDLLGDDFDIGEVAVFEALSDVPLNEIGSAINSVEIGDVLSVDCDLYFKYGDVDYIRVEEFKPIKFKKAYISAPEGTSEQRYAYSEKYRQYYKDDAGGYIKAADFTYADCYDAFTEIASGETVTDELRYKKQPDGTYAQSADGGYKLETGDLTVGAKYDFVQNKHGSFYVADGTKAEDRFFAAEKNPDGLSEEETARLNEKNRKGQYKFVVEYIKTSDASSEQLADFPKLYRPSYYAAVKTVDGEPYLEQKGFLPKEAEPSDGYVEYRLTDETWEYNFGTAAEAEWQPAEKYSIKTDGTPKVLVKDKTGDYAKVYKGDAPDILKAIAECTLQGENSVTNKIGTLTIGQVISVDSDKFVEIPSEGNSLVRETTDENSKIVAVEITVDGAVVEKTDLAENLFYKKENGVLFHYNPNDAADYKKSAYFYRTAKGKTHAVIQKIADCTISDLGGEAMRDVIDSLVIGDVMKVYEKSGYYSESDGVWVDLGTVDAHVWEEYDAANPDHRNKERFNLHEKSSRLMIRLKNVPIGKMGDEITNIKLGEVIDINEENEFEPYDTGATARYKIYKTVKAAEKDSIDEKYFGTFERWTLKAGDSLSAGEEYGDVRLMVMDESGNYKIKDGGSRSNGVFVKMKDITIGTLGSEMQSAVDSTVLKEVLTVDGDVFVKLEQTVYASAKAEVETEGAPYVSKAVFVKKDYMYVEYDAFAGGAAPTEFYAKAHNGKANAAIKKLALVPAAQIPVAMETALNETRLSDVLTIDGDAFEKLTATEYSAAKTEVESWYDDGLFISDKGMYRPVGEYMKATTAQLDDASYTKYVKVKGVFVEYTTQEESVKYIKTDDYISNEETVDGYYKRTTTGGDTPILKRLSTVKLQHIGGSIENALYDSTLSELNITGGGFLADDRLKNCKINEIPETVSEMLSNATMRELNGWASLGLTPEELNTTMTIGGASITIGDMSIKQFIKAAIGIISTMPTP